jgi:ABC-type glycerol-3-phosphate transport system permease component
MSNLQSLKNPDGSRAKRPRTTIAGRGMGIADWLILFVLGSVAILCILPIVHTVALSLSNQASASAGHVFLIPENMNLESYRHLMGDEQFFRSFLISVLRVLLGSSLSMILTIMMAYPLSKTSAQFRWRTPYMWLLVFVMLFNGGLIPWYMTVRGLGITDTIWALVLPSAVQVFNVILLMNFFRSIPKELEEAAYLDGAGPIYTLWAVVLPISMPALATIGLFTVVFHWNSFFDGLILMNDPRNYPLQTYIQQFVVIMDPSRITSVEELEALTKVSSKTLNAAKLVVAIIPILIIYPFLQRYFVKGITLGSVKE